MYSLFFLAPSLHPLTLYLPLFLPLPLSLLANAHKSCGSHMKLKQLNIRAAAHDELLITMMLLVACCCCRQLLLLLLAWRWWLDQSRERERAPVCSPWAAKLFARLPSSFCWLVGWGRLLLPLDCAVESFFFAYLHYIFLAWHVPQQQQRQQQRRQQRQAKIYIESSVKITKQRRADGMKISEIVVYSKTTQWN